MEVGNPFQTPWDIFKHFRLRLRDLKQEQFIDLVIPRGGEGLIRAVVEKSRIPVLKHYKGVCHVFVDESADVDEAARIVVNAKAQRPGVCNAAETLLVHADIAGRALPVLAEALTEAGVALAHELRRLADFLGLSDVAVTGRGELARFTKPHL